MFSNQSLSRRNYYVQNPIANKIDNWLLMEISNKWSEIYICRILRLLWPYSTAERTQNVLTSISLLVEVLSEYMGYTGNYSRMSCLDEREEESVQHLVYDSPVLRRCRKQFFGIHSYRVLFERHLTDKSSKIWNTIHSNRIVFLN